MAKSKAKWASHDTLRGTEPYLQGLAEYRESQCCPSTPAPTDCPYKRELGGPLSNARVAWFLGWLDGRASDCINGWTVTEAAA